MNTIFHFIIGSILLTDCCPSQWQIPSKCFGQIPIFVCKRQSLVSPLSIDNELVPNLPTVNLTVPESSLPLGPMEPEEWPLPTCWYNDAACSERRGSSAEISLNIGEAVGSSDTLRLNFWAATDGTLTRCPSLSFLSLEPPSGMPASPSISPPRKKTWTNRFTWWWSNGIDMQHPKHSVQQLILCVCVYNNLLVEDAFSNQYLSPLMNALQFSWCREHKS